MGAGIGASNLRWFLAFVSWHAVLCGYGVVFVFCLLRTIARQLSEGDPMVLEWLGRTWAAAVDGSSSWNLLFMDNLAGQDVWPSAGAKGARLKAEAAKHKTIVWNVLAGCTDEVQPVGARPALRAVLPAF